MAMESTAHRGCRPEPRAERECARKACFARQAFSFYLGQVEQSEQAIAVTHARRTVARRGHAARARTLLDLDDHAPHQQGSN